MNVIEEIWSYLNEDQKVALLKMENITGYGSIHIFKYHDIKILKTLSSGLSPNLLAELLNIPNKIDKQTPFHLIVRSGSIDTIEESLSRLSPNQKIDVLKAQDLHEDTPIHFITRKSLSNVNFNKYNVAMKIFLSGLNPDQKMELLKMQNESGHTPLHIAIDLIIEYMEEFNYDSVNLIKETLSIADIDKIELLKIENKYGQKILDLLKPSHLQNIFDITFSNEFCNDLKSEGRRKNTVLEEVYKCLKSGIVTNIDITAAPAEKIIVEKERDRILEQILQHPIDSSKSLNVRNHK